jgi:hypothetical protein
MTKPKTKTVSTAAARKNKIFGVEFRHIILCTLFLGVFAQVTHFYDAVTTVYSKDNSNLTMEGILFCAAISGAIIIWTGRNKRYLVLMFTIVEIVVNTYYSYLHCPTTEAMIMGVMLGAVLPISNLFYGEELMFPNAHAKKEVKKKPVLKPILA